MNEERTGDISFCQNITFRRLAFFYVTSNSKLGYADVPEREKHNP